MNQESWNEISFLLSTNLKNDISESEFEQHVIQALRVLQWKEFKGDIQIRPSFQVGASNRITPDFVINSKDRKNLFVIEIKQPSVPISTKFQQQLFSYMRQLRLQYGILIGQVIQVFYDGDLTDHDDPVLIETIDFQKDNPKGEKFVELFSKDGFSFDSLKSFTKNSLKRINRKADQKKLLNILLSREYTQRLKELIKQGFINEYDGELIENVLQEIKIEVTPTKTEEVQLGNFEQTDRVSKSNQSGRDRTRYIINGNTTPLAKNRFVLELIRKYLGEKPSDYNDLKNVFRDEYQGSTGVINKLDFVNEKYANKSNKRHFTAPSEILQSRDGIRFVVSTEWGKGNINNIVDLARREGYHIEES